MIKTGGEESIIKVENLNKNFGDFSAVDGVYFDVKEGEIFAFLGPNGAGKTTTVKILTTLLKPSSGKITIDGYDVVSAQKKVRKIFGIVFQDPSVDEELTAYENMEYHAVLYGVSTRLIRERIKLLLELVELWDRRDSLVKEFSGGMKRRLEIARALVHKPKILYMDEPTVGLDPQTRNYIWEYIQNLNNKEKITVFFTTHYLEEAEKVANRIAVIDHGKIIANGRPEELIKQTKTKSLEEAFLALTGKTIREGESV